MQVRDGFTQVILVFVLIKQYSCSRKLLVNATKFRIKIVYAPNTKKVLLNPIRNLLANTIEYRKGCSYDRAKKVFGHAYKAKMEWSY